MFWFWGIRTEKTLSPSLGWFPFDFFPHLFGCNLHWSWIIGYHFLWLKSCHFCFLQSEGVSVTVAWLGVWVLLRVRSVLFSLTEELLFRHWWAQRSVMKEPSVIFHLGCISDNRSLTYKPVLFLHKFTILWVYGWKDLEIHYIIQFLD